MTTYVATGKTKTPRELEVGDIFVHALYKDDIHNLTLVEVTKTDTLTDLFGREYIAVRVRLVHAEPINGSTDLCPGVEETLGKAAGTIGLGPDVDLKIVAAE